MSLDGIHQQAQATLYGLLLAGGKSVRMNGVDKNVLVYHCFPQLVHSYEILNSLCSRSFISIQYSHVSHAYYREFSQIIDTLDIGPMGGLHAAFSRFPHYAWLALAVDMPMVTTDVLSHLISQRDNQYDATVYCTAEGTEPLCAIYEPSFMVHIHAAIENKNHGLRRALDGASVRRLMCDRKEFFSNINTFSEYIETIHTIKNS